MAASNMPSFNVYTVEDRGKDEDPFWLKIGAAFAHKDGKGFNVILTAFPIDNRLVMRAPAEEPKETERPQQAAKSRRHR